MTDSIKGGPVEVYTELEELLDTNNGHITPEIVWDRAQDPTSSFHNYITWDQGDTAKRFQLQQCAGLIRRFRIVRQSGQRVTEVPAYVRVSDLDNGYRRTQEVITSEFLMQQQRTRLITSMKRLAEQLRNWDEFVGIADLIDDTLGEAS